MEKKKKKKKKKRNKEKKCTVEAIHTILEYRMAIESYPDFMNA